MDLILFSSGNQRNSIHDHPIYPSKKSTLAKVPTLQIVANHEKRMIPVHVSPPSPILLLGDLKKTTTTMLFLGENSPSLQFN